MNSGEFVYSDQDGCSKCNHMGCDVLRPSGAREICLLNYRPTKPYSPPCLFFDRILQGFGE